MLRKIKEYVYDRGTLSSLIRVAIFLLVIIVISYNSYRVFRTAGVSMDPHFDDGDALLVDTRAYNSKVPHRYDIVVLVDIVNFLYFDEYMVKRVIALPGETVEIVDGVILVNDKLLVGDIYGNNELVGQHSGGSGESMQKVVLGSDEIFVIGDNRIESIYGVYLLDEIMGKVVSPK